VTRVDFYILPDRDTGARERFACRLANKVVQNGQRVCLHGKDDAHCQTLDDLLWEYPEHQFLPHRLQQKSSPHTPVDKTPLVISCTEPEPDMDQVLINLAADIPSFFGRFDRVAEIVVHPEAAAGRVRYKFYHHRGYPLFHHDMEDWEDK